MNIIRLTCYKLLQQNMTLRYQQHVLVLIILWWKQQMQLKHVLSCSVERILVLPLSWYWYFFYIIQFVVVSKW